MTKRTHQMGYEMLYKKSELYNDVYVPVVKNMFRFHDALDPIFHLAGLLFPGREE